MGRFQDTTRKETTMASKLNNVLYLAVIRVDGQCIVASYGQPKYESTVNQVVNAPAFRSKVGTGQRIRLVTKEGVAVNFTGGAQGLAVLAITTASYPDRIAFSGLIEDTTQRFLSKGFMWSSSNKDGFTRKFKSDMSELCKEYDDVQSKDKIARLRQQVAVVQSTMQDNISKSLANLESTERLEEQSTNLVASSEQFKRQSSKLAWKEWLMLMKMRFLVALVFLVIVGFIIGFACNWDCSGGASAPANAPAAVVTATPAAA